MTAPILHLDHNAGAPVDEKALEVYGRVCREHPANPSSLHQLGRRAQGVIEEAREEAAALLGVTAAELVFTSGATESNNLALFGAARAAARMVSDPVTIVSTRAEHPSVLGPLRVLQQEGCRLRLADIDRHARVAAPDVLRATEEGRASLLAVQWANNETGCVQPLAAIAAGLDERTHLHVDAVQGVGKLPWDPALARADTWSLSGHKFGAPKGCGLMRVREGALVDAHIVGGGQQRDRRPGTESPPAAAALVTALREALSRQAAFAEETSAACSALLEEVLPACPQARQNQPEAGEEALPNTLSLSFPELDGRSLLVACDAEGLAVSSGSALPSPVLLAAGVPETLARATLRITFGRGSGASMGAEAGRRLANLLMRAYKVAKH